LGIGAVHAGHERGATGRGLEDVGLDAAQGDRLGEEALQHPYAADLLAGGGRAVVDAPLPDQLAQQLDGLFGPAVDPLLRHRRTSARVEGPASTPPSLSPGCCGLMRIRSPARRELD